MLRSGQTIGILGGGQLGRMTAQAAARLGYRSHIFSPEADCPARYVTPFLTEAAYQDEKALAAFADAVDVITLEFENVPLATAEFLAERKPFFPSPSVLAICQNRLKEKTFCQLNGAPTTAFIPVRHAENLDALVGKEWAAAFLKTASSGYDGKGQIRLDKPSHTTVLDAWQSLGTVPCILEAAVNFQYEISIIIARGQDGQTATFPVSHNVHRDQILRTSQVPAPISSDIMALAKDIAEHLAETLKLVGLLTVEMFVTQAGEILVNELAPRPHNSGHWTLDACATSQFEQLVRCIAGLPLGSTTAMAAVTMHNLIGDDATKVDAWLANPLAKVYLYDKPLRSGRKMGHVTVLTLPE